MHGLRRRAGVRRVAHRAQPGPLAEGWGGRAVGDAALQTQAAAAAGVRPGSRRVYEHAVEGPAGAIPQGGASRVARTGRPQPLPGRAAVPALQGEEALQAVHPRVPAPVPAGEDVPIVRRHASAARGAPGAHRRRAHRTGHRPHHNGRPGLDRPRPGRRRRRRPVRPGTRHRRAHPARAGRPPRVPGRGRPGLPHAGPAHALTVRRRGAAHRPGQLAGRQPGRHPVRAGRAHHRAASAGQRPPDRPPQASSRGRQLGPRRGARPRRHRRRRPRRGAGAGQRREGRHLGLPGQLRRAAHGRHGHRPLRGRQRRGGATTSPPPRACTTWTASMCPSRCTRSPWSPA
jgi:hypothetical protein